MRIEDYAMIGDCETAALVGRDGSIDWLCLPDFSSPACFAALLGTKENGRWRLAPRGHTRKVVRRYRPHTLILETTFETETGVVTITDFMPVRGRHPDVIRMAHCSSGRVSMEMELSLRLDYGRTVPWIGSYGGRQWAAVAGGGAVYLRTREAIRNSEGTAFANFTLRAGEQRVFVLTYAAISEGPPKRVNAHRALRETQQFWSEWTRKSNYEGEWKDAIERSLITLKAMTYRPTGGIVAAATTSLPEHIGGSQNWDYRFCWLRDAAFTLESLLSAGYRDEAEAWQDWLLQSVGANVQKMQIMYGVRGERPLPEHEISWLRGYKDSRPVHVGNAASQQFQLDTYGEVADALFTMHQSTVVKDRRVAHFWTAITNYVAAVHGKRSSGIWERRDMLYQFTYSKVMSWVALDRGVRAAESGIIHGPRSSWSRTRGRLRQEICEHSFSRSLCSFVQSYHSNVMDASVLLLPMFGFLSFKDKRVLSTIAAVEKHLMRDGLVYRLKPGRGKRAEGAFLACSFWYVQNLAMTGRREEGRKYFEKLLGLSNDVGLLSEEYDPRGRRLLGNFPQALSHIAMINAGRALSDGSHP